MAKNGKMTIFHGKSLIQWWFPLEMSSMDQVSWGDIRVQIEVTGDEELIIEGAEGLTIEGVQHV